MENYLLNKSKIYNPEIINLYLDAAIAPSALNINFFEEINFLGPFGSGNTEPNFVIENLKVLKSDIVGKKHIKSLLCGKDGTVFRSFTLNAKDTPLESMLDKNSKKNSIPYKSQPDLQAI